MFLGLWLDRGWVSLWLIMIYENVTSSSKKAIAISHLNRRDPKNLKRVCRFKMQNRNLQLVFTYFIVELYQIIAESRISQKTILLKHDL